MSEEEIKILVSQANEILKKLNIELRYNPCAHLSSQTAPTFWIEGDIYPKKPEHKPEPSHMFQSWDMPSWEMKDYYL